MLRLVGGRDFSANNQPKNERAAMLNRQDCEERDKRANNSADLSEQRAFTKPKTKTVDITLSDDTAGEPLGG